MLLQLLIVAIVVGTVVYIVRLIPMDEVVKRIIVIIAVVIFAIYALKIVLPMAGMS